MGADIGRSQDALLVFSRGSPMLGGDTDLRVRQRWKGWLGRDGSRDLYPTGSVLFLGVKGEEGSDESTCKTS